jgi:hypothetical protein
MADVASYFVPFDLDTGGGTELVTGFTLRGAASGGSLPVFSDPAALADNASNPTVGGAAAFGMVFDGATWDRMLGDATDGVLVNLGANNEVTVAGTVTVDTELPDAAALTDSLANPTAPAVGSHLMAFDRVNTDWTRVDGLIDNQVVNAATGGFLQFGTDGSNYQAIAVDSAGNLQVDVLSGGGGAPAPTNPVIDTQTSALVAVATPTDIDTAEAANKRLVKIDIFASVSWKGEVFTVDNAIESSRLGVTGGSPHKSVQWVPPHPDYIQLGATAGLDAFRLKVTNLDDNQAADFHAVFYFED